MATWSASDVFKIFGLFDSPPHVTFTNQQILFLSSALWGTPSPQPMLRTSYMEAPFVFESVWPRYKILA